MEMIYQNTLLFNNSINNLADTPEGNNGANNIGEQAENGNGNTL